MLAAFVDDARECIATGGKPAGTLALPRAELFRRQHRIQVGTGREVAGELFGGDFTHVGFRSRFREYPFSVRNFRSAELHKNLSFTPSDSARVSIADTSLSASNVLIGRFSLDSASGRGWGLLRVAFMYALRIISVLHPGNKNRIASLNLYYKTAL